MGSDENTCKLKIPPQNNSRTRPEEDQLGEVGVRSLGEDGPSSGPEALAHQLLIGLELERRGERED
eukprot:6118866-Pyramimonas_sp.AAC.1